MKEVHRLYQRHIDFAMGQPNLPHNFEGWSRSLVSSPLRGQQDQGTKGHRKSHGRREEKE